MKQIVGRLKRTSMEKGQKFSGETWATYKETREGQRELLVVVGAYRDGSFMRKSRRPVPRLDLGSNDDLDGVGVFFLEYVIHHRVDHTSHFCARCLFRVGLRGGCYGYGQLPVRTNIVHWRGI